MNIRTILLVCFHCLLLFTRAQTPSISGFRKSAAAAQFALEKKFDDVLDAANVGKYIREMSATPHHVGSPGDKANADYLFEKFKSWGYNAEVETFYVLFPTPKTRLLEMTGTPAFRATLAEQALKQDATSGQTSLQLPVYNCYSPDGDVTGELVFVNYGVPADYEELARLGVDVKGRIVIAKYGQSWRGIKPKVAQEHGAIGCIIYSDPKEDGYFAGDVYPKGPFRPAFGAQRGSVEDMPIYPGDPLTPGIGATKDAKRLDRKDAPNLLKIPVLPISYADAQPLLASLEGAVVPPSWRGALPITYHVGPGKNKVHLKLEFDWQIKPVNNVIARLPGSEFPNEWVIRGNHHDAWVNGANDPVSGQAAMLEEARSIGALAKNGWKPKRTIIFCAWDGEEPGLLGSTEWVEYHEKELKENGVIYINSDDNGRGFLEAGGSQALEPAFTEVTRGVIDPEKQVSVFDRRLASDIIGANSTTTRKELLERKLFVLDALGSGSDFSPFAQHIGMPCLNIAFAGENGGGEYHSIYDSYDLYKRFKDPDFVYGVALAKTTGHTLLRMANAETLPFDFRNLQYTIGKYITELIHLADEMRESTAIQNRLIADKFYSLADRVDAPLLAPPAKAEVPYLDFSALQNSIGMLEKSAALLKAALDSNAARELVKTALNKKLYQAEQVLLTNEGLPRRPWYRHSVYAPGFYTGYGVKTLPGVREALEERNWKEAQEQIGIAAARIKTLSDYLGTLATEAAQR